MAIARKCDRCGCYYDTPSTETLSGFQWLKGGVNPTGIIDLCADCCDKLSDWIEGDRENLTETESAKIPYEKPVIGDSVEEVTTKGFVSLLEEVEEPAEEPVGEVVTSKPDKQPIDTESLVRERLTGKMPKQIAEEHGLKPNTVSRYISTFKAEFPERYAEMEQSAKNR